MSSTFPISRPEPTHTLGDRVAGFFKTSLAHTKGARFGEPFVLEPWQQEDIDLIYETDGSGRRVWRSVLYGLPRGNGKSPMVAGVGLLELLARKDSPDIRCAAAAKDQAGIVLAFARDFVTTGHLAAVIRPYRNELRCERNRGTMKVLSADGALQHGLSVSVSLIDEWHAFLTDKQREVYYALATATHKRRDSLEMAITTAGFDKASQLGERWQTMMNLPDVHREGCLTIARDPETRSLMIWRGAEDDADIEDPTIWRDCNPASWIDSDELRIQQRKLPENVFRRLHLNQWTASEAAWLPEGAWRACMGDTRIAAGSPVYLGVDIGLKKDSSAVVTAARLPDGRFAVSARIFTPKGDGTPLDLADVENFIREQAREFDVREVAFDPHMFMRSAQTLSDEGLMMVECPQTNERMVPASLRAYDLINGRKLEHDGDRLFASHVAAGATMETERGWRVTKRKSTGPIDALIALILALSRADEPEPNWGFDFT